MNIPLDKQLHLLAGGAIAGVFMSLGPIGAMLAAFVAGLGKEAFDYVANKRAGVDVHTVDPYDVLATFGGGVAVVAASQAVAFFVPLITALV